ncbi:hypothetical protein A2U01_0035482 [Trifolium medium]|uniref:Uncharacterized protein n=1 Tax=Trifolium medium TaxID=97028 RepID=A0A392PRN8_9FABA|nr:hypothetical protein [Trifolium medium]
MDRVEQPIKSDCQDVSLDGGRDRYLVLILGELSRILGRRDQLNGPRVLGVRSTWESWRADMAEETTSYAYVDEEVALLGRPLMTRAEVDLGHL